MSRATSGSCVEPLHGAVRGARVSMVTMVVVAVSLLCHVATGGMRPSAHAVAVVATLTAVASVWLTRWRLSAPRLASLMVLVEALTHLMCVRLAPMHAMSPSVTPGMVAAHLLAAAVSVAYLRSGEDILWSMLESWAARVSTGLRPVRPRLTESVPGFASTLPLAGRLDLTCSCIRGPPA